MYIERPCSPSANTEALAGNLRSWSMLITRSSAPSINPPKNGVRERKSLRSSDSDIGNTGDNLLSAHAFDLDHGLPVSGRLRRADRHDDDAADAPVRGGRDALQRCPDRDLRHQRLRAQVEHSCQLPG